MNKFVHNFSLLLLIIATVSCTKLKINKKGCIDPAYNELVSDTCYIFVPNIFSPNSDGINDLLKPFCNCEITDYNFEIRKNGRLIFKTNDQSSFWDGTYQEEVTEGVLNYQITGEINGKDFGNKGEITSISLFYDNDIVEIENCETCTFADQLNRINSYFYNYCEECLTNEPWLCPECNFTNQINEGDFYIGNTSEYGYCK